jgi:predicted metalloendopeptidase
MSRSGCYPHHTLLLALLALGAPFAVLAAPMCEDFHAGINGNANELPSAFVEAEAAAQSLLGETLENARRATSAQRIQSSDLASVGTYLQALADHDAREAAGLRALSPLIDRLAQAEDVQALQAVVSDWQRRGLLDAALGTRSILPQQPVATAAASIAQLFAAAGGNSEAGSHADAFTAARVELRWTQLAGGDHGRSLARLMAELPVAHLRTWLRWRLIDRLASDLPPSLAIHAGHPVGDHADVLAGQITQFRLRQPLGRLFAKRLPQADARVQRAQSLAEEIRTGFMLQMAEARWLGPQARTEAQRKIARTDIRIGDTSAAGPFPLLAVDDHLANAIALTLHSAQDVGAAPAVPAWSTRILYHYASNTLVLPLAALQDPLFPLGDDAAAAHGSLGAVIGHELAHAIDSRGRTIDAEGLNRNWWSADDQAAYTRQFAALIGDHSRQQGALRGLAGLDENFADLIGVDVAHRALLANPATSERHHEQQFFAGWARLWRGTLPQSGEGHAPSRHRVNTPLAHSAAFASAYGCATHSPMARAATQRIDPWLADSGRIAAVGHAVAGPG